MRILFVENHAIFAAQVSRLFLSAHEIKVVPTVRAATQALAAQEYDLLLVDYDLDDGKGDELLRAIRVSRPHLPAIAVSAHQNGNDALLKAGAVAVCSKMQFDKIQSVIEGVQGKRQSRDWPGFAE